MANPEMDANQLEQKLRGKMHLTDDLRADLFDLHMDNAEAIKHPVLKAIALMSRMSPEDLELAEQFPNVLKTMLGAKK